MIGALLDWGVAARALAGETESGDRHVVKLIPGGALLAVVDGLGHGEEAAAAARTATATIEGHAGEPVLSLLKRCHEKLRASRGVVMSLVSFSEPDATMTWLGVGNVEGVLVRADPRARPARESLLLRGGVVGGQLPLVHASIVPVLAGDTLILATDGISGGFDHGPFRSGSPQEIADRILARHSKGSDDALVLVARYRGDAP